LLNELQALNERTQQEITLTTKDLQGRISEKENLDLKLSEQMQVREKLRQRQSALTN
jgi:hypothetical protein